MRLEIKGKEKLSHHCYAFKQKRGGAGTGRESLKLRGCSLNDGISEEIVRGRCGERPTKDEEEGNTPLIMDNQETSRACGNSRQKGKGILHDTTEGRV